MDSILWGINLVYLLTFASLYIQLPGLIGDEGVAPVRLLDMSSPNTLEDFLLGIPSIIRFSKKVHLSEYHATELLVVIGLTLSLLCMAVPRLRGTLSLVIQWISFFSVVQVCPGMTDWKWTSLLIESGFLCFLLSIKLRANSRSSSVIIIWLIKWLLFREAIASGFTKLANQDYNWWNLSAMEHYFSSQLSPTPIAWYYNLLPVWILRILTAIAIAMNIFVPFLFFIPIHGLQMFSLCAKFNYHANLMITGNYGIYNLLCIILSFAILPEIKRKQRKPSVGRRIISIATTAAVLAVLSYIVWVFFGLHEGVKALRITIPHRQFIGLAKIVISCTIPIASALFVLSLLCAICRSLSRKRRCMDNLLDFTGVVLVGLLGSGLFVASLVPFSNLGNSGSIVPLPRFAYELTSALKPLHLANDYRFCHQVERDALTKVGPQRAMLVLEGSVTENGPWTEFSFRHVPNALMNKPSIIHGHWPVVDFEAALASERTFDNSPIVAALVHQLLNNQKEVLPLLEASGLPDGAKFIQIKKYSYVMTKSLDAPQWWKRKLQAVYLPPTEVSSPRLIRMMKKLGIIGGRRQYVVGAGFVSSALDKMRAMVGQTSNLNGLYVVLVLIFLANKLFF